MNYKMKIAVGGIAVVSGVASRICDTAVAVNGADFLAFVGCWFLWLGLVKEWPKPAPRNKEASASATAEKRRRSFLRLFKEE